MHGETPDFKRCCFCLPLRRGLIVWGYTKLVFNLLMIAYFVFLMSWYIHRNRSYDPRDIAIFTTIHIALLIDLSFTVIFIVGGHKKSVKLLNIAYIYNLIWLGLVLLGNGFLLYVNLGSLYRLWGYVDYRLYLIFDMALGSGLGFSVLFVQIYIILLIRSELKKLRNQSLEMQFSNHLDMGEPQCILQNATDKDGTGKQ